MNSLNILSSIGTTPPPSPPRSRAPSASNIHSAQPRSTSPQHANDAGAAQIASSDEQGIMVARRAGGATTEEADTGASEVNEKTPLLEENTRGPFPEARVPRAWLIPQRISSVFIGTVKVLLAAVVAPGRYLVACFQEEDGHFSLLSPVYKISRSFSRKGRKTTPITSARAATAADVHEKGRRSSRQLSVSQTKMRKSAKRIPSEGSAITSDSELESERSIDSPSRNTRSKSTASSTTEEINPGKRSMVIKLHPNEEVRQRKAKKSARNAAKDGSGHVSPEAAAALKSPMAQPAVSSKQLTRFPRAPQPPRPLVPRRQPSYSTSGLSAVGPHQKTLIIDLDETLIHSSSKGGRFTTGHMVEVKLEQPVGAGPQIIGPQVPILYYVHKRPYCDEFLKKVCKWYNLVVFTASVQEYADPVIDWLEVERKYFAGRYYRQHCTLRNGFYIKDLAQVEPDLSKVMILDNSPYSYAFHEDNAVPIEGWVSDPTDNDLLYLIPLLEGLQHVTDVRALLALRSGQPKSA